ncbi:MAG: hypothetical protein GEU93_07560 [Propionibacteriales bacterium]|nr:hypothetical protein [Propionibacteriales bacterium]
MTDKQRAAEEIAERLAKRDPADTEWRDGAPLRRIGEAFRRSVDAERELADAVDAARVKGYSWAAIAAVLGVSKQTAQHRYGTRSQR